MRNIPFVSWIMIILTTILKSQSLDSATLKGFYYGNEIKEFELQKQGVRTLLNKDPDVETKINEDKSFKIILNISAPSFYKIGDLYVGHTIFIEPNDRLFVSLKKRKISPGKENLISQEFDLTTTAKFFGNITFYDNLEKKIGATIKYNFEKPEDFKVKCDKAYKVAIDLLSDYRAKKVITPTFYKYASEDLKARYVLWFCEMLAIRDKTKISPTVFKNVESMKFTDSTMFVSSDPYTIAPAVYNYYIANSYNPKNTYQNLDKEFASILKGHTGFMRDRLMGWQLNDYIGKNHPAFDSCYQIFLIECKNEKIKREVKNKLTAYVAPLKKLIAGDINILLSKTQVQNSNNKIFSLADVLSDTSITLIDCWAIWCIPCRKQMPFVREIEKKYTGKLKVVYLSFDKDELKWKTFLQNNTSPENEYLISNSFSSEFSTFFNLETIPRYILISKKGMNVLDEKMPFPALVEDFENELRKYIH